MTFDAAGNLITDTYTGAGTRTYDAENRMTTAADNTGQTSRYAYDADGNRVRRQVGSGQEEWQIYGFDGELLAEYRSSSPASVTKEYGYRDGQLLVTAEPATASTNVALASNGAVAMASSTWTNPPWSYLPSSVNNGDHRGLNASNNSNWASRHCFAAVGGSCI